MARLLELAMQQQKIHALWQHYEESLGKMEASYQLLQQWVEQDMEELWAEHASQAAQQTQSLHDAL